MATKPSRTLETFPNPNPERDYEIRFEAPEFTCVCPMTGQPDFATIRVRYVPHQKCVELKSFKLYLWSYRDEGAFHEAVTNRIADDLIRALDPRLFPWKVISTFAAESRRRSRSSTGSEAGPLHPRISRQRAS